MRPQNSKRTSAGFCKSTPESRSASGASRAGCTSSARSAAATTSSRSASTKRTACGRCCTRAAAASATPSARISFELAKTDAERNQIQLPDRDLAYFPEGAQHFDDYVEAVGWAQDYARANREEMMDLVLEAMRRHLPSFEVTGGGGQLPPQLRRARGALRRAGLAHAQGRDPRRRRRARHHPRQHGRAQLHRARQGLGGELPFVRARRRPEDEPQRRAEALFHRRISQPRPRA